MQRVLAQAARFGAVGLFATLVHLCTAWTAHHLLGFQPLLANIAGFGVAFAFSYLGHFYWTFGHNSGHPVYLPRFLVVSAIGFGLTNLITWSVTGMAGLSFDVALGVILIAVPLTTWTLSRLWAFRA
ncbi:MAG: GtrA family protein [Paracoccaceae bacterium]